MAGKMISVIVMLPLRLSRSVTLAKTHLCSYCIYSVLQFWCSLDHLLPENTLYT